MSRARAWSIVFGVLTIAVGLMLLLGVETSRVNGQGGTGRVSPTPTPTPTRPRATPPRVNPPRRGGAGSTSGTSTGTRTPRKSDTAGMSAASRAAAIQSIRDNLVRIPADSFTMGSTNGDSDEKPAHQVTIGQSFYMGKYEVTQAQWQAVMGSNPSEFKGDNLPVENVSWNDAQEFIGKLNARNVGYVYRLPSEAEWEYACRAGTSGDYAGNLDAMAWYDGNSNSTTHPVGSKQPNSFGLFDMHGNVYEWCEDWNHGSYAGAPTDGSAWLSGGEQKSRVLRGGSWGSLATRLRSAYRYYFAPDTRGSNIGFRVVASSR